MTTDPTTRDQLAYARLIIKEAQRHGGAAWLDYDRAFRQQRAADPSIPWNSLNPSLLASTILGSRSTGQGAFCTLCRMVDHTRSQCALAYLEASSSTPQNPRRGYGDYAPVCFHWNKGTCRLPRCNFRHVCSVCFKPSHKAASCPQAVPASTRPGQSMDPTTPMTK